MARGMPKGRRVRLGERTQAFVDGRDAAAQDWPHDEMQDYPVALSGRRAILAAWREGYRHEREARREA